MDKNTSWAVNVWKQWSAHRHQVCASYSDWSTHLIIAAPSELNYWLSKLNFCSRSQKGWWRALPHWHPACNLQWFIAIHLRDQTWNQPLQGFCLCRISAYPWCRVETTALTRSWSQKEASRANLNWGEKLAVGERATRWRQTTSTTWYHFLSVWNSFCTTQWWRASQSLASSIWVGNPQRRKCSPHL